MKIEGDNDKEVINQPYQFFCDLFVDFLLFIQLPVLCLTKYTASNGIRTCSFASDELLNYLVCVPAFISSSFFLM